MTSAADATPTPLAGGVFRTAALDKATSPDDFNVAAGIVRSSSWILLVVCAAVVLAAVVGSIFIKVPVKVKAEGILISPAGVRDVSAVMGGQIRNLAVEVGQHVEVGQSLAEIAQPDLRGEIAAADADLRDARDQLSRTEAFQGRSLASQSLFRAQQRDALKESIDFTQQRVGWLEDRLKDQEGLAAKGVVARQTLLQARVDLGTARDELSHSSNALKQLDVDENTQRLESERELLALGLKVSSAERHVELLNDRLKRADVVTSPYAGTVAELKVNDGETVEHGTALLTLIPDDAKGARDTLVASLFVPADEGKKVRPGMEVQVLPTTEKREEHGFILARVLSVSAVPATQEGMERLLKNQRVVQSLSASGAPFAVQAELLRDPGTATGYRWSTSSGPDAPLSIDSPCHAEIVTQTQSLLRLLIPAVKSVVERFV